MGILNRHLGWAYCALLFVGCNSPFAPQLESSTQTISNSASVAAAPNKPGTATSAPSAAPTATTAPTAAPISGTNPSPTPVSCVKKTATPNPGQCDIIWPDDYAGKKNNGNPLGATDFPIGTTFISPSDFKPGQTVCIRSGNYHQFYADSVKGSATQPITFVNCGGQVVFSSVGTTIGFTGSQYIHLTGTGTTGVPYGIVAYNTSPGSAAMVDFTDGSSDIEIDHVEAKGDPFTYKTSGVQDYSHTGGTGIAVRTYPTCGRYKTNTSTGEVTITLAQGTWKYGTFNQNNTLIHDNYIHDTGNEGMYIGPSHGGHVSTDSYYNPGFPCAVNGPFPAAQILEAELNHVEIRNNTLEHIGNDGIEVGNASSGYNIIANNRVYDFGTNMRSELCTSPALQCTASQNAQAQQASGVQVGIGTKIIVDSNVFENPVPNTRMTQGLKFQGVSGTVFSNNLVIGAYNGMQLLRNVDAQMELTPATPGVFFYNNTVVTSYSDAFIAWCNYVPNIYIQNNIFAGYPNGYASGSGGAACYNGIATKNLFFSTVNAANFADPSTGNYHLSSSSSAANSGTNLSTNPSDFAIDKDIAGSSRLNGTYDFGAYSY